MKIWGIVLCFIVLFAIFCSPGLAVISKSDLISQYKSGYFPTPTPIPTTDEFDNQASGPTQAPSKWFSPIVPDSYITTKRSYFDSLYDSLYPAHGFIFADVKKPNIYLYGDRDLTALVQLTPEKAIAVSEPVYQPGQGWLAQIRDGSLNGNGDFLFYEALVPDSGWQKEEGYVIRASSREQDMAAMLGQYGFNDKETVEFIEYWANHLTEDVDYVFYPQETAAVERVMPLSISPEPDHVSRIWFSAEPLGSVPDPVTDPETIVREGFYVVEWGVMIR